MNVTEYSKFIDHKKIISNDVGFDCNGSFSHGGLFPFQEKIVKWAIKRGRAAIFADCGLGKTFMQLEWLRNIHYEKSDIETSLIVAPLAVSKQTVREGERFGIQVNHCRSGDDIGPGINITNYESLHKFKPECFGALVLDESSILKSFSGVYRNNLNEFASGIDFRLACTATPAPNDLIEIVNHADFLNIMSAKEVIACFFTQDGNTTHKWRLKRHAIKAFWEWMASWSIAIRKPSDIGFDDDGFDLPEIHFHEHIVNIKIENMNTLFPMEAVTLEERRDARKNSIVERVKQCSDIVNNSDEQWVVWCNLNAESNALKKAIDGAVEVKGADSSEHKEKSIIEFAADNIKCIVTKPLIAGFGINWQNCRNIMFVGLSDSFEQFYQAVRRCWRFGQEKSVNVHLIISEQEGPILENIKRKERSSALMMDEIVSHMKDHQMKIKRYEIYQEDSACACGNCI